MLFFIAKKACDKDCKAVQKAAVQLILSFLLVVIWPFSAFSQRSCLNLFVAESPHLDTQTHEKSFKTYLSGDKYVVDINNPKIRAQFEWYFKKYGEEEVLNYLSKEKRLEVGMNGVLGSIFDLVPNPHAKKIEIKKSNIFYNEIKNLTEFSFLKKLYKTNEFDQIYDSALKIENLDNDHILITIDSLKSKNETEIESYIKWRLRTMYYETVNWKYRAEGLIDNKISSEYIMRDDELVYANKNQLFEFNLVFDKKVWNVQKEYINYLIKQLNLEKSEIAKKEILNQIGHNELPFLPSAGLVQAKPVLLNFYLDYQKAGLDYKLEPVELKRYFKNEYIDPFNMLNIDTQSGDFILRHKMIYSVIDRLPHGALLEIHVHSMKDNPDYSKALINKYIKIGFSVKEIISDEKFKESEVILLTSTKEISQKALNTILNGSQ